MNASAAPSATFLFCVESGYIEGQIVMAVECIRKFAGRLAKAPILVTTPRFGPSLTDATLGRLQELGVTYIRRDLRNPWDWYVYMNKASGAMLGEELATTDQILWLDSDVLVINEPSALLLAPGEDFACCSVDKNVGSSGPDDPNEAYWKAMSDHFRIPVERLPWVETAHDRRRVRFRLHSGVYSFRRGCGLGKGFVEDMGRMLESRIGFSQSLPYPGDDVALAYTIVRLGLTWRILPMACNYEMTPTSQIYRLEDARNAQVLHFHHALASPEGTDWFLKELSTFRPDVVDWLRGHVPLQKKPGGIHRQVVRKTLAVIRDRRRSRHQSTCRMMVKE